MGLRNRPDGRKDHVWCMPRSVLVHSCLRELCRAATAGHWRAERLPRPKMVGIQGPNLHEASIRVRRIRDGCQVRGTGTVFKSLCTEGKLLKAGT